MAYSTFQSVTGPSGPEGVKAVGVIGVTGNTGPTGATGPNSPHLTDYEYPYDNNRGKAKLVFSDLSSIVIDAVTGPNAFPVREQVRPTNQTSTDGLGSYIGLTAGAKNIGSSGRVFVSQSDGPGTGTTFQFRGLTASGDLQLYVTDTQILIGGTGGATSGYVDRGATGEFLHLDPRWKAQGGHGTFFGASADNTGTGDTIKVKFRNVIDEVTDEFDSAFCGKVFNVRQLGNDNLREYILDVSSVCRYVRGNPGVTYGNICVNVITKTQPDRLVILRTKTDDPEETKKLKYPLWGANSINFDDPLSGIVSFSDEGYGNEEDRREIINFNTPYINADEGYFFGDGVESNVHPQTWNILDSGDPIPCPPRNNGEVVIYDSGCKSNEDFVGAKFRNKEFCTVGPLTIAGYTAASYCLEITEDMFESQDTTDPWFGKIRMVVMPSCGVDQSDIQPEYGFQLDCQCDCNHTSTQCCDSSDCGSLTESSDVITGRINLDITNTNFFQVKAPFQIAGITWAYEQRPGLSLSANDAVSYAEMKNITLVVEGGPNNIKFPDNVFFSEKPTFTNGIDIVNLATIDNGDTWFATMSGYGWNIDVYKSSDIGSCCNNLNCLDFVNQEYCDSISGIFEQNLSCANRTDDVCGAGITGACCSGVGESTIEYSCNADAPTFCECQGESPPADCPDGDYGTLDSPGCENGFCGHWCFGSGFNQCNDGGAGGDECCQEGATEPGNCQSCLPSCVGSCCTQDRFGGHVCYGIKNCCEAAICTGQYGECAYKRAPCSARGPGQGEIGCNPFDGVSIVKYGSDGYPEIDPCSFSDKFCCTDCALGGDCLPYSSSGNSSGEYDTIQCPGGVVDDCSECTNLEITTIVRPVCLTPATALSCNLINGYFVPADSVVPPQVPCDVCSELDACQPFVFGTCCNKYTGECYGINTELQCSLTNPDSEWTPDTEDCDICCPKKEYRGACCLCVDECIDLLTPQQCSAIGGLFMGDESSCADVSCASSGSCDCVCEGELCCNCEGSSKRSSCCDDTGNPDCCNPDLECCDPPGCGCQNPGGPPCEDGFRDPPNSPDQDGNDFDFAGFSSFAGIGGGGGGGGIDPRSEWLTGSCCIFGENCNDGQFMVSRNDENFNPNTSTDKICKGTFSPEPCFMSGCKETKFIGSCCCMYWTLDCVLGNNQWDSTDSTSCNSCSVNDIKITCSNCDFDGDIAGWNRPWDASGGSYKPWDGTIFNPTEDKVTEPGKPYTTPNGIELPYSWQDCCKNPGGCSAKPCIVEDRVELETLRLYDHKEQKCEDPTGVFDADCQSGCGSSDLHDCFCNIATESIDTPDNCSLENIQKANSICGWCNKQTDDCEDNPCDPRGDDVNRATAETLELVSEISSCNGCDCLPTPALPDCAGGPCDQYVFSSCRFIHDKTKSPAGFGTDQIGTSCQGNQAPLPPTKVPVAGENGSAANSIGLGNGVCKDRADKVWGPSLIDPSIPDGSGWNNPFNTTNDGFLPPTQSSQQEFRRIKNRGKVINTQTGDVYEIGFI